MIDVCNGLRFIKIIYNITKISTRIIYSSV
jgi:hypothetical protein